MKMSNARELKIWLVSSAWLRQWNDLSPNPVFARSQLAPLSANLIKAVEKIDGAELVGSRTRKLANTISFVVRGTDSAALLAGLDLEGICASSGSACSAGSLEPSHVIAALGRRALANSLIRFSLGCDSTAAEVKLVCDLLPDIVRRSQLGK